MRTSVRGVTITLTPEQEAQVNKVLKQRERCRKSFEKVLLHFQFKMETDVREDLVGYCFYHPYYSWWAEIQDYTNYHEVWMVGAPLRQGPFPGGWMYSTPLEVEEALTKALDELQNKDYDKE